MSRFDNVQFDEDAQKMYVLFLSLFKEVDEAIGNLLPEGRSKATALTKLEESAMWAFKAVRDDQWRRQKIDAEVK
jgi:hypothetical protein